MPCMLDYKFKNDWNIKEAIDISHFVLFFGYGKVSYTSKEMDQR